MSRVTFTIDSIFEGQMPSALFGGQGQFLSSIGIDPDVPLTDAASDIKTGGAIRPVQYAQFSSTEIDSAPIAIVNEPKSDMTWVILSNGKIVAYKDTLTAADSYSIGQVTGSAARGAWYQNNYIYVTTLTDVSRIGPLNTLPFDGQTVNFTVGATVTGGTSGATAVIISQVDAGATGTLTLQQISGIFIDNEAITDSSTGAAVVNRPFSSLISNTFWTGTLVKTALSNTGYPTTLFSIGYLNHFGWLHHNNVGYFLDYKDGIGYVHGISTRKVTNEGDTDATVVPSAYSMLDLPQGYAPLVGCSYGNDIVVSATPTSDSTVNQGNAKVFFWDTTADSFYRTLTLPDPICTVLQYENGVLYGISGAISGGYRLWRYVGGDAIETLKIIEDGYPPLQMAADFVSNRFVWGANTTYPYITSGLYAYGSKSDLFPRGLHHIVKNSLT